MGTTFKELCEDWVMVVINDYKLDKLYVVNENALLDYLRGFILTGLTDFDCLTPLTYSSHEVITTTTDENNQTTTTTTIEYEFDYDLSDDEKKIISEIAVAKYFKRFIHDVKARAPYINQREFKKDALAPIMKENDNWYKQLVSEYEADIANYYIKNIDKLDYWSDLS